MKQKQLKIKDHSYSQEEFDLIYDANLDKYTTTPFPQNLDDYYKTENYISHTDTEEGFTARLYHLVKRFMLRRKLRLIERYSENKSILDIGAGTGDFLIQAQKRGWEVCGVEPSLIARKNAAKKGIELLETQDELNAEKFEIITMWHVLEHVPDVAKQIRWISDHLLENGTAIIAVPNFNSFDANYYQEFWAAWDVPRHLHHFSAKSIKMLFEKESFKLIDQKPLLFDSFYVSLLSENYKKSSLAPLRGFFVGFISNLRGMSSKEYSSLIFVLKKTQ